MIKIRIAFKKKKQIQTFKFETIAEVEAFKEGLEARKNNTPYQICPLNTMEVIDEDSKWANETFQVIVLASETIKKTVYHYNHRGTSYYLFTSLWSLISYFVEKKDFPLEFETEEEMDNFLEYVDLYNLEKEVNLIRSLQHGMTY